MNTNGRIAYIKIAESMKHLENTIGVLDCLTDEEKEFACKENIEMVMKHLDSARRILNIIKDSTDCESMKE